MAIKFSKDVSKQITDFLFKTKNLQSNIPEKLALFDADGTLWFGDLGESFLEYQVEHGLLKNPPAHQDPWKFYWDTVLKGEGKKAYNWPIQWNAGVEVTQFQKMARDFFKTVHSKFVFKPIQNLIAQLQEAGFEVWVITASTQLVVAEAVSEAFGIPANRVIGAQVEIENGILTDNLSNELPYREAKVRMAQKVILKDSNVKPLFAAGNTVWDYPMLSLSEGMVLTIHSEIKGQFNYDSEQELKQKAQEMNLMPGNTIPWLIQGFSRDDFE